MSYMGSIAMRGKSIVGSPTETIMPSEAVFRSLIEEPSVHPGLTEVGEQPLPVSSVYGVDESVMDRRK